MSAVTRTDAAATRAATLTRHRTVTIASPDRLSAAQTSALAGVLAAHHAGALTGPAHTLDGYIDLWDETTTDDPTWRITTLDTVDGVRILLTRREDTDPGTAATAGRLIAEALTLAGVDPDAITVACA